MSRRQKRGGNAVEKRGDNAVEQRGEAVTIVLSTPTPNPCSPAWWPEEFCRPRTAWILAGAVIAWGALLFGLAAMDRLLWLKIIIGWLVGLWRPDMVNPNPWDLAAVWWCLGVTILAGLVHPAVGLAVLGFLRPWLDGYTYPRDNVYFLWAAGVLFAFWSARVMLRGERIRLKTPLMLLGAFLAVAAATSAASIQFDRTYRELLNWCGYFALFVLAANTLHSRRISNFLLIALAVSMAAETIFSLLHFHYLLPYLRKMVQNPQVLRYFFDTDVMTPELARRFNVNRAFGSMLFPNALAAFLILGLPYHAAAAFTAWRRVKRLWQPAGDAEKSGAWRYRAVAIGAIVWFVVFLALYAGGQFAAMYQYEDASLSSVIIGVGIASAIVALLPAVFFFWVADGYGTAVSGRTMLAAGLSLLTVLQCWALWLTYSRGGMLALIAGGVVGAFLYWSGSIPLPGRGRLAKAAALALAGVVAAGMLLGSVERAQNDAGPSAERTAGPAAENTAGPSAERTAGPAAENTAGPSAEVTEEGLHVTLKDLADPATMALRLTYWRVGWRMFREHFWTGVGLKNFGIAYPKYQYLGAGEVKEAHNSFLQIFCETGIVGGLLMLAFWAWVAVWGAGRVLGQADRSERLILAGLLGGMLAFLAHSAIDINFSHPSLMMFIMVYAGIFCARAAQIPAPPAPEIADNDRHLPSQIAGMGFLLGIALLLGLSARVFALDLALTRVSFINLANQDELIRRYHAGRFFTEEVQYNAWDRKQGKDLPDPRIKFSTAYAFIGNVELLHRFGPVIAPLPDRARGVRRVQPGEAVPPNAVLVITYPVRAIWRGFQAAYRWMDELESYDARFPYDPDLALHLSRWCELMVMVCHGEELAEKRREYMDRMLYWAQTAVRRSPLHADVYMNHGSALWTYAAFAPGPEKAECYRLAIEQFRRATELSPTQVLPPIYQADACRKLADAYQEIGDEANAQRYLQEADALDAQVEALREARRALGLWG